MELTAQKRDTTKKTGSLRKMGVLPAVVYGRKEAATAISIPYREFEKVLEEAGESSVIVLRGLGADKEVLIHAVEVDPLSSKPIHADFYSIEKGQTVTVSVPLEFIGTSPAVKDLGGVLVKVIRELEMEVLPKELPHEIAVDVTVLKDIGAQIHIRDLVLPPSAIITIDGDEVVVMIAAAQEEEVETPAAPIDLSQIEVQERGKKEDTESVEAPE